MCAIEDAEPWVLFDEQERTAAKEHECIECRRTIAKGERYHYATGLMADYGWDSFKTCRHCKIAAGWLRTICGGYMLHGVHEELCEHWHEGYESLWLGRAIKGMEREWRDLDPLPPFECDHRWTSRYRPHNWTVRKGEENKLWCACGADVTPELADA